MNAQSIEQEIQIHVEDTPLVNAVRNGKLVQVSWNDLEEWEKREAEAVTFRLYSTEYA